MVGGISVAAASAAYPGSAFTLACVLLSSQKRPLGSEMLLGLASTAIGAPA